MSEMYCDAKTVLITYECDECGNGFLAYTGESEFVKTDEGGDMVFNHRCPSCGAFKDFINIKYPYSMVFGSDNREDYKYRNI